MFLLLVVCILDRRNQVGDNNTKDLPHMWAAMLSWFTSVVLFTLLNVVIGTIVITYGMHPNNTIIRDLKINPSLLYKLSTFNVSRDKF